MLNVAFPNLEDIAIYLLLLSLGIPYILVCLHKPWWIISALAIYLPFEEFVLKWVPYNLYTILRYLGEVTIIFVFFAYAVNTIFTTKKWPRTPIDIPIIILLGSITISTVLNQVAPIIAVLGVKNLLRYIILFYLIILIKPTQKQIIRLLEVLFFIALVQSTIALAQTIFGKPAYDFFAARDVIVAGEYIRSGEAVKLTSSSYHTFVFGTMGRYNILGNYLAMWLGITCAIFFARNNVLKIKTWHLFLLVGALIFSFSRMSWIALFLSIILLFQLSKKNKIITYIVTFLLVSLTLLGILMTKDVIDTSIVDSGQGSIFERYLDIFLPGYWKIALEAGRGYVYFSIVPAILKVKPFFGFGPGTLTSDVSSLLNIDNSVIISKLQLINPYAIRFLGDAGFATIIAQLGIIGFLGICLLFLQLARTGIQFYQYATTKERPFAVAYILTVIMMLAFNLVSFSLIYRIPSFHFWLFSAFIVLQTTLAKKRALNSTYDTKIHFTIDPKTKKRSRLSA